MKILLATPLSPQQGGGPAQYTPNLARALQKRGHVVDQLVFQEVAHYPSGVRHIILFFKALVRVKKVNVVIILDTLSVAFPVVLATWILRKKSIIRCAGDFVWERYVERTGEKITLSSFYSITRSLSLKEKCAMWMQKYIIFPLVYHVVFSTNWQKQIWMQPYNLFKNHITIIENAYQPFTPSDSTRNNPADIVWIGRDIALKNVDTLDAAMEIVKRRYPSAQYKKYSDISHEAVIEVLEKCRMLVIPSLSEVSPNLALEAIALGSPVILTKECGIYDVLHDTVVWIDPLDIHDVAIRIMELMEDEKYAQITQRVNNFTTVRSYDMVAEEFLALI